MSEEKTKISYSESQFQIVVLKISDAQYMILEVLKIEIETDISWLCKQVQY